MIPCILFHCVYSLFLFLFPCYLYLYSVDSVYVVLVKSSVSSILHFYGFMERLNKLKLKLKLKLIICLLLEQRKKSW
jgi:hypothetical protein